MDQFWLAIILGIGAVPLVIGALTGHILNFIGGTGGAVGALFGTAIRTPVAHCRQILGLPAKTEHNPDG